MALFTSYAQLRATSKVIAPLLLRDGIIVYEQGDGVSRRAMLDQFRGAERAVILGTRSFWEGVEGVATIATEKTRAVKMAVETDKVTLSVTSPDNGNAATGPDSKSKTHIVTGQISQRRPLE